MKKKILLITALLTTALLLGGWGNKNLLDTTYYFNKAILSLPNGEIIEGDVINWRDYEDGDQIQVRIGTTTYLVHSSNVVLIAE